MKTIWEQHKQRIQNQKVVCTTHTLCKCAVFKDLDHEKKDYYCNKCFDVGKCGALAVEEAHLHYCIENKQGKERHLYQVKVNAPIARDAKDHILKACIIGAVVTFLELNPDKIIFISIHFHYDFLPSGGKECRNPQPLDILFDHRDLHFTKYIQCSKQTPTKLQMHTKCFWPKCHQCNQSGGGASVQIQPTKTIPITLPQHNPGWGIRGSSIGNQPTPRTFDPGCQYFIGWGLSPTTSFILYQFQDSRWCDPTWWDPIFWEYQPMIADNNSWQLWYQGQSTPFQQQQRTRPVLPPGEEEVKPRIT